MDRGPFNEDLSLGIIDCLVAAKRGFRKLPLSCRLAYLLFISGRGAAILRIEAGSAASDGLEREAPKSAAIQLAGFVVMGTSIFDFSTG